MVIFDRISQTLGLWAGTYPIAVVVVSLVVGAVVGYVLGSPKKKKS